jgi:hypothetical protein
MPVATRGRTRLAPRDTQHPHTMQRSAHTHIHIHIHTHTHTHAHTRTHTHTHAHLLVALPYEVQQPQLQPLHLVGGGAEAGL